MKNDNFLDEIFPVVGFIRLAKAPTEPAYDGDPFFKAYQDGCNVVVAGPPYPSGYEEGFPNPFEGVDMRLFKKSVQKLCRIPDGYIIRVEIKCPWIFEPETIVKIGEDIDEAYKKFK